MAKNLDLLLPEIVGLAREAGRAILQIYRHEELVVTTKNDASPVTQADIVAHNILVEGLSQLTPGVPVLSEEGDLPSYEARQQWSQYWLIDPLDGTKEFIARTDEFSVNVALIVDHEPVMGVIVSPIRESCYTALSGFGAFCQDAAGHPHPLKTRQWPRTGSLSIAVSRHHQSERLAELMATHGEYSTLVMGSSLKFCAIAESQADFYPRFGRTCEWDTAAGQCILTEAGGAVVGLEGVALRYNTKEDIYNPGFIATGDLQSLLRHIVSIRELSAQIYK